MSVLATTPTIFFVDRCSDETVFDCFDLLILQSASAVALSMLIVYAASLLALQLLLPHRSDSKKKVLTIKVYYRRAATDGLLSYILLGRLEPYANKIIGDHQCGFRRNRSTIDPIFLLKLLMEKKWEYAQIHAFLRHPVPDT